MNQLLQSKVIECLRRERRLWTVAELKTSSGVDVANSKELQSSLKSNPRVKIHKEPPHVFLSYRPQVEDVSNAEELMVDFRKRCMENGRLTGVPRRLYSDTYDGVERDLDHLIAEHRLMSMTSQETKEENLYHDDPGLYAAVKLDQDVRKVMGMVELPADRVDLKRYLDQHDLPVSGPQHVPLAATGRKRVRSRSRQKPAIPRKATNVHMGVQWLKETHQRHSG